MKVYIVLEDDRGMGPSVVSAYLSQKRALQEASESSHYWVDSVELDEDE